MHLVVMVMLAKRHSLSIKSRFTVLIGTMSQKLMNGLGGHLQDSTRSLLLRVGIHSSTFGSHLAQVWQQNSNSIPTATMLRDAVSCSIFWKGDPFSCSKTFGKLLSCKLCQKERIVLLHDKWALPNPWMLSPLNKVSSVNYTIRYWWSQLRWKGCDLLFSRVLSGYQVWNWPHIR
jgi:hypothetical protein